MGVLPDEILIRGSHEGTLFDGKAMYVWLNPLFRQKFHSIRNSTSAHKRKFSIISDIALIALLIQHEFMAF